MIVHLTSSNVTCFFLFVSFRKNCSRASKKTQVRHMFHYDLESNLMGLLHGGVVEL